jgi:hypothetical protein
MFAMRAIGGIVSLLMIIDRGQGVFKWSSFLGEGWGHELLSLGCCKRRNFFGKPNTSGSGINEP